MRLPSWSKPSGGMTGSGTSWGTFFEEIDTAITRIQEAPNTWPEFRQGTRRFLVHRFPFAVVYSQCANSLLVVAVMHLKRRPDY